MTDKNKMRASFVAWADGVDGGYRDAWGAWQAALSQPVAAPVLTEGQFADVDRAIRILRDSGYPGEANDLADVRASLSEQRLAVVDGRDAALLDAVGKLVKAKGRFHTEQNYVALVAAYDAAMQRGEGERA